LEKKLWKRRQTNLDSLYNQGCTWRPWKKLRIQRIALRLKASGKRLHSPLFERTYRYGRGDTQGAEGKLSRALAFDGDERIETLLCSLRGAPPLVQTVKGAKGSCVAINTHANTLIVYEKDKRGFSLYDFDTGTYKGFISGEDAETGLALAGARHGSAFDLRQGCACATVCRKSAPRTFLKTRTMLCLYGHLPERIGNQRRRPCAQENKNAAGGFEGPACDNVEHQA
jgi:hypothetical protein